MNEWELTDEEIKQCEEDARRVSTIDLSTPIDPYWLKQNLIKAQARKLVEWLEQNGGFELDHSGAPIFFHVDYRVWQALRKGVGFNEF